VQLVRLGRWLRMANALYDLGREGFLDGSIDWDTDNIILLLADSGVYTPNLATDKFISDVTAGGATIARSGNLASKTVTAGVANAAAVTLSAVTGAQSEYLILAKNTGSDATSRLICRIDTATGLPVTPGGGDIVINFDTGANKIFKL
jgi:hypothetical protein